MKVLLINPPTKYMITTNLPEIVEEERGHSPPLGIMYVASYVKKYTSYDIEILDADAENLNYKQVEEFIRKSLPDVVGISVTTFTLIDSVKVAKIVKMINKGIKVVFGGPHVNIYPRETINIPEVDFLVLGEGEMVFTDLLKNIKHRKRLKKTKGLVFKENRKVVNTECVGLINDLDKLPFPDRKMIKNEKYSSLIAKSSPITTMFTSRGCPYRCSFCHRPHLGKIFRARSAKNVVDEMEQCVKMGIKEIFIYDDTFTIDRKRVLDICKEVKKRGLKVGWDVRARVNTVDKELLKEMKEAGCERVHYGVESGNQNILNILNKGITIDQVKKAFKATKKNGIETLAYFMIGCPTETKKEVMETIEFSKELDPDFIHFSVLTPFPATRIYLEGIEKGVFKDVWKKFSKNPKEDFEPPIWEENLRKEELYKFLIYAYKSFYSRPIYIFKRILKMRSPGEMYRKVYAGVKILLK